MPILTHSSDFLTDVSKAIYFTSLNSLGAANLFGNVWRKHWVRLRRVFAPYLFIFLNVVCSVCEETDVRICGNKIYDDQIARNEDKKPRSSFPFATEMAWAEPILGMTP